MCSDGVLDSKKDNSNWLKRNIRKYGNNRSSKIADILISEAKR